MVLNVNFKLLNGCTFSLDLEPSMTILALKCLLQEKTNVEPQQMKLIFKGRVLNEMDALELAHVESGQTVAVVWNRAAAAKATPPPTNGPTLNTSSPIPNGFAQATPLPTNSPTVATSLPVANGSLGDVGAGDPDAIAAGGMAGTAVADPMVAVSTAIGNMCSNPAIVSQMQSIMQNSLHVLQNNSHNIDTARVGEAFQQMAQNNPLLQQLIQVGNVGPQEIGQMFTDPESLQEQIDMLSNPRALRILSNPQMVQSLMRMASANSELADEIDEQFKWNEQVMETLSDTQMMQSLSDIIVASPEHADRVMEALQGMRHLRSSLGCGLCSFSSGLLPWSGNPLAAVIEDIGLQRERILQRLFPSQVVILAETDAEPNGDTDDE